MTTGVSSFDSRSRAAADAKSNILASGRHQALGPRVKQEGQHPLTGQRAPPISGGTYRRRRTLIDGYLESPFPTARLL